MQEVVSAVAAPDDAVARAARDRMDGRTKPRGSLGDLDDVAVRYAAARRWIDCAPVTPVVVAAAAGQGVTAYGVSAYPPEVTGQMVATVLRGGATSAVLARPVGTRLAVVDRGTASDRPREGVLDCRPREGRRGDLLLTNPLPSAAGAAHARRLAVAVAATAPVAVYSSPRRRAMATASAVVAEAGLPVLCCGDLRELDFGAFEGRRYDDLRREHPVLYGRWMTDPTGVRFPAARASPICAPSRWRR